MRSTSLCLAAVVACSLPAAAAPAWKRLGVERATSTSYLQSNWNKYDENYHPNYVLDDNPKTAWVEGVEGNGEGQSITLPFSELKSARSLKVTIFNGYQKSAALLKANAAPAAVTLTVRDAGGDEVAAKKATLEKKMGAQDVVIDVPKNRSIASVTLTIDGSIDGSAYKDNCVSDIAVYVDSDVAYRADVENKKMAAAKAWIKERVSTAKAFAARPTTYPFASTHFTYGNDAFADEDTATWRDDSPTPTPIAGRVPFGEQLAQQKPVGVVAKSFSAAELASLDLADGSGTYRLDSKQKTPAPDGLEALWQYVPVDVLAAFAGPGVTFFEATKDTEKVDEGVTRSRYAVVFNEKDKKLAKKVTFHQRIETHEREDYVENRDVELSFDDKGLLVAARTKSVEDNSDGVSVSLLTFERDDAGRITAVTVKAASGGTTAKAGLANTTYTARFTAQQPGA